MLDTVTYTINSNSQELKQMNLMYRIPGQSGLHSETLSQIYHHYHHSCHCHHHHNDHHPTTTTSKILKEERKTNNKVLKCIVTKRAPVWETLLQDD